MRKFADAARKQGYKLPNDSFSIAAGWLGQGANNWVNLYDFSLEQERDYVFFAAGDRDARDVDLEVRGLQWESGGQGRGHRTGGCRVARPPPLLADTRFVRACMRRTIMSTAYVSE